MSSRDAILARIREAQPASIPLPEQFRFSTGYPDKKEKFAEVLASIGGEAVFVSGWDEIIASLEERYGDVTGKASDIPELNSWVDFSLRLEDPHELEMLQIAVIQAETGVAENSAIWVPETILSHRVLPFITQYLAIVIPASGIVNNMHDAFDRIGVIEEGWGAFIAGPSKTADIEQSLVVGAHGARGLTVFVLDR